MKAIVYERYGPPEVLHLKEIETPTPKANEVRIKVQATTVTTYDCWGRSGTAPPGFGLLSRMASGFNKPKQPVLGTELAGEIEAVGTGVTQCAKGDEVFGFAASSGAHAEYICLPEEAVVTKPVNMTYEEAAAVPYGALTALFFLKKANIQAGQKVLIYGASGGVGMYTLQLARYFGAGVTGVCSTSKLEWVKSLGADTVIDYAQEDFTKNGQVYDVIFDSIGKTAVSKCKKSLKHDGFYIFATFGLPKLLQMLWLSLTSHQHIIYGMLDAKPEDFMFLKELIEAGQLRAIIDKCYPMEQIVEAHRYVESGRKRGSVVITMGHKASSDQ